MGTAKIDFVRRCIAPTSPRAQTVAGRGRQHGRRQPRDAFQVRARSVRITAPSARRDASLAYWQSIDGLPLPMGVQRPPHDLAWYKSQRFSHVPGNPE
jgi:hypothetical protein